MRSFADALQSITVTLWVGGQWAIGFIVAPLLFARLPDRALAGMLAGKLFTIVAFIGIACASCPKAGHCGPSRPESASGVPRRACLSGKVRGPGNFPNYLRSIARLMLRASSAGAICASSQPGNGATVTLDGPRQPLDLLPERL